MTFQQNNFKTKKEYILEFSTNYLIENGLENIAITDICKEAGVKRTTLQHHYPKITDLYIAIVRSEQHRFLDLKDMDPTGFGPEWSKKQNADPRFRLMNEIILKLLSMQKGLTTLQNEELNKAFNKFPDTLVYYSASLCLMQNMQNARLVGGNVAA
ncbi:MULTISPECIES: TetR/AcrR family transcriptional regulator [Vibrio]|uniref:TetR/AcrR family transcriptional regulator n=1 Tax=Vibrio TaxID=662 RepID=UPI000841930A|nr:MULTISPECIES: TetR/AcrR family transcriptional regulator [Vibrio]ODM56924.1 hypothetical protein BC455_17675 [Vibrio harveyi]USD58447.1 TetR/AcrR family transcriptional regulator [Vibrio sp. SCSIO 43155]